MSDATKETAKHTPGPWTVDDGALPIQVSARGLDKLVADVGGQLSYRQGDDEPNALLIAAAPELLEALEKLCNAFDPLPGSHNEPFVMDPFKAARDTIAKALGK